MTVTPHFPVTLRNSLFSAQDADRELFQTHLASFVPPGSFDVHVHLYTIAGLNLNVPLSPDEAQERIGFDDFRKGLRTWMGDLAPTDGLFFARPRHHDVLVEDDNQFVIEEARKSSGSKALMLVRPSDNPDEVEQQIKRDGFAGMKVYHLLADGPDTFNLPAEAFLTDWMWEIADRHQLAIMLHMVRPTALADVGNQRFIHEKCKRYPGARLILAHAARGFCSHHTVDAIDSLHGLDNVFFDTSAVCESAAMQAIIQATGCSKLMFGTDWPISEIRGRCVSVGYGFFWMYPDNVDYTAGAFATPTLVGLESLLAVRQACRLAKITDSQVEQIFCVNARKLLGL